MSIPTEKSNDIVKGIKLSSFIQEEYDLIESWALGEYDNPPDGCPNCGRFRLCICDNGKHRCEKCNWVPENDEYCPIS